MASRLTLALWALAVAVVLLGLAREVAIQTIGDGSFLQEWRHFDLDSEANLPSWFSSATMLLIAALAAVAAFAGAADRRLRRGWTLIAGVFVLLSLDEASSFHEAVMDPLRDWLGVSGALHYAWIIPAIPLVALFVFATLRLLKSLPKALLATMVVAGLLFVAGAIGMEMIAGLIVADGNERSVLAYRAEIVAEETLEIAGLVLFATALIRHIADSGIRIVGRIGSR